MLHNFDINTTFGMIEALGGDRIVARDLGISPQKVREWTISGDIPSGWHLRLFGRACRFGKTVSPAVFGFRDDDEGAHGLVAMMMVARYQATGGAHV